MTRMAPNYVSTYHSNARLSRDIFGCDWSVLLCLRRSSVRGDKSATSNTGIDAAIPKCFARFPTDRKGGRNHSVMEGSSSSTIKLHPRKRGSIQCERNSPSSSFGAAHAPKKRRRLRVHVDERRRSAHGKCCRHFLCYRTSSSLLQACLKCYVSGYHAT